MSIVKYLNINPAFLDPIVIVLSKLVKLLELRI